MFRTKLLSFIDEAGQGPCAALTMLRLFGTEGRLHPLEL